MQNKTDINSFHRIHFVWYALQLACLDMNTVQFMKVYVYSEFKNTFCKNNIYGDTNVFISIYKYLASDLQVGLQVTYKWLTSHL